MIKHRLFVKGEKIFALLSSNSYPNILIPVKAIVKDVKYDQINPRYLLKVITFYDNILFLKKYLFNMSFSNKFDKRARNIQLNPDTIKNKEDLYEVMSKNESKYYFVVDSIMTKKFKGELFELFNKIQDHLIEKKFRECRDYMTRIKYTGVYKITGDSEFEKRLKNFVGDKIKRKNMPYSKYFRLL